MKAGDVVECTHCHSRWHLSANRDLYTCSKPDCGAGGFCYGCLMSHWNSEHPWNARELERAAKESSQ